MIVEMRIYHCAPTRLPALLDRFTSTTLGFFEKYGIEQIGFWTTLIGPSNHALTYMLKWKASLSASRSGTRFRPTPSGSRSAPRRKQRGRSSSASRITS